MTKLTKAQEKRLYSRTATKEDIMDIIDDAVGVALARQKKEHLETMRELKEVAIDEQKETILQAIDQTIQTINND